MHVITNKKVCLLLGVILLLPLSPLVSAGGMIETVTGNKKLTIGVALFEPWVMKDRLGELMGYDIDVAKQLAKDLKVSAEFKLLPLSQLLNALQAGQVDIIISGLTITTERNIKVNFTIPYAESGIQLLANRQATRTGFSQVDDFNRKEINLAVVKETLAESIVEEQFPLASKTVFEEEAAALMAVKQGQVTAMLAATPLPEQQVARHPDLLSMPVPEKLRRTNEAFMIRKQDPDSLNVLNNWILQRISDGWLPDRHDYWFTSTQWRSRL